MKQVWISLLGKNEDTAKKLMAAVKHYGLEPKGHFWDSDLSKSQWAGPRNDMLDPNLALWIIAGARQDIMDRDTRYGLSMLSTMVQAGRGHGFPTIVLHADKDKVETKDLPTPLKHAEILPASSPTLGAKLVARANTPFKPAQADYRLDAYGLAQLGTWIEIGPAKEIWKGVILGVAGEEADIDSHGVGKKGELPRDKMVLNYQQKGLKLKVGDREFTAWAVQNQLDPDASYYARVTGKPDVLLFGEFSQTDEAEMFMVSLT